MEEIVLENVDQTALIVVIGLMDTVAATQDG